MRCRLLFGDYIKITQFISMIRHRNLKIYIKQSNLKLILDFIDDRTNLTYEVEIAELNKKTINRLAQLNQVLTGNLSIYVHEIGDTWFDDREIEQILRAMFSGKNSVQLSYTAVCKIIFLDHVRELELFHFQHIDKLKEMFEFTIYLVRLYKLSKIELYNYCEVDLKEWVEEMNIENYIITEKGYNLYIVEFQ